jgi:hypothetical protein
MNNLDKANNYTLNKFIANTQFQVSNRDIELLLSFSNYVGLGEELNKVIAVDKVQHAKDLAMVKQDGEDLRHVKVQTLEICLAAVNQTGYALEHVDVQTIEICLAGVNQNGNALRYVRAQTEEICIAAVKNHVRHLKNVDEQFQEVCKEYLANNS